MSRVLLIDDDQGILEVVRIILQDEGYEVFTIEDVENIEKEVEKIMPNLILLDIWMPGVSGEEICLSLKTNKKTTAIPLVMLSASMKTKEIAEKCKADGYLPKPFEMDDLVDTVRKFLKD